MQYVLWTLCCIIAYIGGLMLIARVTPRLLVRQFDDIWFMGIAALDICGGLLLFGAVFLLFALFNGAWPIRIVNVLLLLGAAVITGRLALYALRGAAVAKAVRSSRFLAGGFCVFLTFAALFYIIQLFIAR